MTTTSFLEIVRNPERLFSRRLTYRDAVPPLLLAIGVGVFLAHAYRPFFAEAIIGSLPAGASSEAVDSIVSRVFRFSAIGAVVVPLAQVSVTAALAFMFLAAWGDSLPRFESLCACVSWAALLITGKDLARYAMLLAGGLEAVRDITDLQPGVGLGFLWSVPNSLMHDLLETINGFDIGYIAALAFAISRSEAISIRSALAAAGISALLLHAVRIGFGVLFYQGQ